jgi:membrane fusion protein, multidrug efflux system
MNGAIRTAAFSVAAALMLAGCQKPQAPASMQRPAPVTVVAAATEDVPVYLDEIGQGTASESVTMTPQVSGRIIERHFEDGADLKQGQLLFTIDPRPFQAAVDSAQAQLAQSKAALDLAKSQLEIWSAVADTRAVSKSDYDIKKNAVAVNEAQVLAAQAALESAKLNLEYCYIHSPVDGRAGRRLVDAGNVVIANQTPLLSVQRLDPIYADFIITERDLPRVQEEMERGTLKTLVRLPADAEATACPGELTFLDNAVQNGTGTVNLRATFANPGHHFWPGQFVRVRLVLSMKKGAVLVPNEATQIGQQGPFVYVVKADGTADLRQVVLGQHHGDRVVIESGVEGGEMVVVTGQMMVNPGGKVQVVETSPGGNSAAGVQAAQGGQQRAKAGGGGS